MQKRALKANAVKSKRMVLGGEEGSVWEGIVDRRQLEYVLELKSLGLMLGESDIDGSERCECDHISCEFQELRLKCARMLHEGLRLACAW